MNETQCIQRIRTRIRNSDHPKAPDPEQFQPTSVMALFLFRREPELLFIQKADIPGYPWRNQMAFPGGHVDASDPSPLDAALREVKEELNIRSQNIEVMGSIGHFQTINYKDIHAFSGIWNQKDEIRFETAEIQRVFNIPLAFLMNLHREKGYMGRPANIMTASYPYEGVDIWGVTAKILHHLLELLMTKK